MMAKMPNMVENCIEKRHHTFMKVGKFDKCKI